jgi:hypothetical protein
MKITELAHIVYSTYFAIILTKSIGLHFGHFLQTHLVTLLTTPMLTSIKCRDSFEIRSRFDGHFMVEAIKSFFRSLHT